MIRHELKIHRARDKLSRETELAWKMAQIAADPVAIDDDVAATVIDRIIDNAAVAIAAYGHDPVRTTRDQALAFPRKGGATVFGMPNDVRCAANWAGWANAAAVRELDYNDTIFVVGGAHPADNIGPIIAVAQQCGTDGTALIRGIATAYEIQIALVKSINLHRYGIDHVAHIGPAVAAGIGTLLGLDTEVTYQAIQQAAHVTLSGRQARRGLISSWKAHACAHAGRCAIEAVDRAMRGEASPTPVYEGEEGIFSVFLDGRDFSGGIELPAFGEPKRAISETYAKEHSAAYHGQAFIDLAFLMRDRVPDFDQVESIVLHSKHFTHIALGTGTDDPEKFDPEASRETLDHSVMFMFAIALQDGEWHHTRSYLKERVGRPDTVRLWRKVRTVEDPEWSRRYDESAPLAKPHGGRAVVTLKSGERIIDEIEMPNAHPRGARPFARADYIRKFRSLTEDIVEPSEADRFIDLAERLATLSPAELKDLNVVVRPGAFAEPPRPLRTIF